MHCTVLTRRTTHQRHAIYRGLVACRMKQPAYCSKFAPKHAVVAYGSATHPFASIHVRLWRNAIRALWPHGKHNKNAGGGEGIFRFHPARATYRGVMTDLHDSWHKTPQSGDADSGCIEGARSVSSQCHGDRRYADVTLVDHSVWCHTHTSDANVWESSTVMYGAEKHRHGPRSHRRCMGMKLRHGRHRRKSPARPPGPVRASTAHSSDGGCRF